jgi:hypothetical protein
LDFKASGSSLSIFPDNEIAPDILFRKDDPVYHHKILEWLRDRARKTEHISDLLQLRNDETNICALAFDHPDVVRHLMPLLSEFESMPRTEKEIVTRWIVRHIGQWNPRIRFTVDNTIGKRQLQLISLRYDVKKVGIFLADMSTPQISENHLPLKYVEGMQEWTLASQGNLGEISVNVGGVATFDIIFEPEEKAPVASKWSGEISLITNQSTLRVGELDLATFNGQRGGIQRK